MKRVFLVMLGGLALSGACECMAAEAPSRHAIRHTLNKQEQNLLDAWLGRHPQLRQATVQDCKCMDDVEDLRKSSGSPQPDYHPYRVVGDFNGDGVDDFAVVLTAIGKPAGPGAKPNVLLIFNGPFGQDANAPAFEANIDMADYALFCFPPGQDYPGTKRLAVAPFAADVAFWLVPNKNTYDMKAVDESAEN